MVSFALALFLTSPFLMLRMSDGGGSFPKPLSPEEEQHYLKRLAEGDEQARGVLIERNLRLVAHIMKKYYTKVEDQDDLIQIGTVGLIKGISTFKPDKNARLATYASRCIQNEILMYFRTQKKMAGDVSLSDSIDTDTDGNSLSLMDIVSVPDDMLDNISARETRERLARYIAEGLTPREAEIIAMRYGLGGRRAGTQREIAKECGISRSYVSRIEKKALEKLKKCFEDADFQ
ncbi:MAG: RNA polymerase sporulation sigma factor SigK [Oscillospiraceae bacterium]|jgi:RNA polymerase sporulation-specific sigma factor|nr:RNA polymerase sporulation sigma factor SigK [Oscillospiraceae bacterium]